MKWNELKSEIEDSLNRNLSILKQEGEPFTERNLREMFRAVMNNIDCGVGLDAEVEVLDVQPPKRETILHIENHCMECVGCGKLRPMTELSLLHPKRGEKRGIWTSEPDFFCQPCVQENGLGDLPQHDKQEWLNAATEGA